MPSRTICPVCLSGLSKHFQNLGIFKNPGLKRFIHVYNLIPRFTFARRIDNYIPQKIYLEFCINTTFSRIHVYCANPRCQRTIAMCFV